MTTSETDQVKTWKGEFGEDYTERNTFDTPEAFDEAYIRRYGSTRDQLSADWLRDIPKTARILEVGSNIGHQLLSLKAIGFERLFGIEIQRHCVEKAKTFAPGIDIIEGSAFDIPFKDGFFDLVFTNNVLIHFSPNDIGAIFNEMHRVSSRYIWGFEYFAPQYTEIPYRGHEGLLWKADYGQLILDRFPDMQSCREKEYDCLDELGNVDKAYLLEKTS
jgi:pseudaminic acid biosynthesis-associated methylase